MPVLQSWKLWEFRFTHVLANTLWYWFNFSHTSGCIVASCGFICSSVAYWSWRCSPVPSSKSFQSDSSGIHCLLPYGCPHGPCHLLERPSFPHCVATEPLSPARWGSKWCSLFWTCEPWSRTTCCDDIHFIVLISGSLICWTLLFFRIIFAIFDPLLFNIHFE